MKPRSVFCTNWFCGWNEFARRCCIYTAWIRHDWRMGTQTEWDEGLDVCRFLVSFSRFDVFCKEYGCTNSAHFVHETEFLRFSIHLSVSFHLPTLTVNVPNRQRAEYYFIICNRECTLHQAAGLYRRADEWSWLFWRFIWAHPSTSWRNSIWCNYFICWRATFSFGSVASCNRS